jgi:hypothetical protein
MHMIRISAANLVRITLEDKLLIGLNKKRYEVGKKIYTPFGGALQFHESARMFLEGLGAAFEKNNDLRIRIAHEKLPEFTKWFYQQKQRETSPYRELREELVEEENALPDLPEKAISLEYLSTVTEKAVTDRPGQAGKFTQRFFEIYRATFTPDYEQHLRTSLTQPGTHLGLVTEREINEGISDNGIEIASNCKPLILSTTYLQNQS